jgi:hypothetical protein
MIDRRRLLAAGLAATLAPAMSVPARAQPADAKPKPNPNREDRIKAAARNARRKLDYDGRSFSGPAWDWLVEQGRASHFFLLGEQHGVAENPKLAAQLFKALVPAGYSRIAIEISPPMAAELDTALLGGMDGIRRHFADPHAAVAFYGMREEAEFLAAARAALPGGKPFLWGTDYDIAGDRRLIALLKRKRKPAAAQAALAALEKASAASWAQYDATRNPQFIYGFSGDPALVRAVRAAWAKPDARSAWILDTLESTFSINQLWAQKQGYRSNEMRSEAMRRNFLRHWRAEKAAGRTPKVLLKYGASHVVRGRHNAEVHDLGALVPEIAAIDGGRAFHLLVLNGPGTEIAMFDPTSFTYKPGKDESYAEGLEPIVGEAWPDAFTLVETAPLRPLLSYAKEPAHPELMRVVHGFDAVLILSGSTPSAGL